MRSSDFLDHLIRETPSKLLINLRRSYFARHGDPRDRYLVGYGVEAMKGVYQSIRMAEVICISLLGFDFTNILVRDVAW